MHDIQSLGVKAIFHGADMRQPSEIEDLIHTVQKTWGHIDILVNKIRLERPLLQPFDGPYNRVKNWLKQFYSDGSEAANSTLAKYKNDW